MPISEQALLMIISDLYGTLSDCTEWHEVLERIAQAIGCPTVTLDIFNLAPQGILFSATHGMASEIDEIYISQFARTDPKVPRAVSLGFQGTWRDRELLTPDEIHRSPVYQELWYPNRLGDQLHSFSVFDGDAGMVMSCMGDKGGNGFRGEVVDLCNTLLPHIGRVARTQLRLATIDIMQAGASYALDSIAIGVILIGVDGRVLHVNRAAKSMLDENDGLLVSRSGLKAIHSAQDIIVRRMIEDAIAVSLGETAVMAVDATHVTRTAFKRPYAVMVTPVSLKTQFLDHLRPSALVFVVDPERDLHLQEEYISGAFGLTPAEVRLAVRLISGQRLADCAHVLGVKEGTARNQLKSIFQKTGTGSQGELIALLLKMNIPV